MAAFVLNANGKKIITSRLNGTGTSPVNIAWGTGTATATAADTALATPAAPTTTTAVAGTGSTVTTTNNLDTFQVVGTITASGTVAIGEVALLDGTTIASSQYFLRADHGVMNLSSGDSITYTIKTQFT